MSTKHVRTTGDLLRFGCSLRVDCTFCGNSRTFTPREAAIAFANSPMKGVSARLRCIRCGFKQARATVLSPL